MRQIRVGYTVKAFLDSRICGKVINIVYLPSSTMMMVGGVPPLDAYADVELESGKIVRVKTTELSIEDS
jgi:hypothetical protein